MVSHIPDLPKFDSVIDDSPTCHQSLKYWGSKAFEVGDTIRKVASGLHHYHDTGTKHHRAGSNLSEVMNAAAKAFKSDKMLEEPLIKFSDALNRIECYRDMLLTQTQMLGVEPMLKVVKETEKMKRCRGKLNKTSESLHVSWAKFANLPHLSHLPEPQLLDKNAHSMITARQKYQLYLADYTENVRKTNTQKKVLLTQRILEHMLAQFSFFNYCQQILKDLEPYMNTLFEDLQIKLAEDEQMSAADEIARRKIETEIDNLAIKERSMFPSGEQWSNPAQSTGRFFNKVGGFISSGVKDLKKNYKEDGNKAEEQDWEVIDEPKKEGEEFTDEPSPRTASMSTASHFYLPLNDDTNSNPNADLVKDEEIDKNEENKENEPDGIFKNNKVAAADETKMSHEDELSKKGYLRIKQKAFPKSKYPLLYFILDKKYGELLSQGQDQKQPKTFAKLMLSAVKLCDSNETDRNYCFQLVTSDAEHTLQARNSEELSDWMKAIQDGIATALDGNQERQRLHARGRSLKDFQQERKMSTTAHDAVERLKAIDGNDKCADCSCPRPGWASSNLGVVICIECSGVHRGLGVHISKVKSLSLDKWKKSLLEFMERHGNTKVNKAYEANIGFVKKISRDSSKVERLEYIKSKYVDKAFYVAEANEEEQEEKLDEVESENEPTLDNEYDEEDNQVNLSIMCLVKDCEDCKAGRHGNVPNELDGSNSESSGLVVSSDHFSEESENAQRKSSESTL